MIKIYYWPDAYWISEEDVDDETFLGQSDDFGVMEVAGDLGAEEIDNCVEQAVNFKGGASKE